MSDPPSPPPELPDDVVEALGERSPALLRQVARYAEALAEHREREARLAEQTEPDDAGEDRPDDVPAKATLTVKEINDNRYYYWQWRDGDAIRSKYRGPVAPDE